MPLEIHSGDRIYQPKEEIQKRVATNPFSSSLSAPVSASATNRMEDEEAPSIKFRFQHDVESLFWVMLWIVLFRVGGQEVLVLAGEIFTLSDAPSLKRIAFFKSKKDGLSAKMREELKPLAPLLLDIRSKLYDSYESERSADIMNLVQYQEVYMEVFGLFTAVTSLAWFVKGVDFQNPPTRKRGHTEVEAGSDEEGMLGLPRIRHHT